MGAVALRGTLTTPRAACAAAAQLPPWEDDPGRVLPGPDPSESAAHLDVPALDHPDGGVRRRLDAPDRPRLSTRRGAVQGTARFARQRPGPPAAAREE